MQKEAPYANRPLCQLVNELDKPRTKLKQTTILIALSTDFSDWGIKVDVKNTAVSFTLNEELQFFAVLSYLDYLAEALAKKLKDRENEKEYILAVANNLNASKEKGTSGRAGFAFSFMNSAFAVAPMYEEISSIKEGLEEEKKILNDPIQLTLKHIRDLIGKYIPYIGYTLEYISGLDVLYNEATQYDPLKLES